MSPLAVEVVSLLAGLACVAAALKLARPAPPAVGTDDLVRDRFIAEIGEEGPTEIEGVATLASGDRLMAPLSRDLCLWYEVSMERLAKNPDGAWTWGTIATERQGVPFYVDDGTGRAVARPGAQAPLGPVHRFESVNPAHHRVREWRERHVALGIDGGITDRMLARQGLEVRFREHRLRDGDVVRVEGNAKRAANGEWTIDATRGGPPPAAPTPQSASRSRASAIAAAGKSHLGAGKSALAALFALTGVALLAWGALSLADALTHGTVHAALADYGLRR